MKMPIFLRALVGFLVLSSVGLAHDFWLDPSAWEFSISKPTTVTLRVGENFIGDSVPRYETGIERFSFVNARGETKIAGINGQSPAGTIAPRPSESAILLYRSRRTAIEIEPAKFESYLREEGLERIVTERAKRGESGKPAKEVFSRAAKAIVGKPDAASKGLVSKSHGLTLELIPLGDPRVRSRQGNSFRLLYRGKPLEGALVVAFSKKNPRAKVSARTDRSGKVALSIDTSGEWIVKSVHMSRINENVADWESIWASLTFLRV